jgi:hypothetical protein
VPANRIAKNGNILDWISRFRLQIDYVIADPIEYIVRYQNAVGSRNSHTHAACAVDDVVLNSDPFYMLSGCRLR